MCRQNSSIFKLCGEFRWIKFNNINDVLVGLANMVLSLSHCNWFTHDHVSQRVFVIGHDNPRPHAIGLGAQLGIGRD